MKRYVYITLALLALMAGQAHAQRCLPGMKGVRLTAEMADGFYCGANRHDAGYAFSLAVSTYTKKGNQWVFGGETLRRNLPYRNTHIPTAQYTGEGGYYHTFFSSPGKVLFLNLGVSALLGYETVNGGKKLLDDGAALHRCESFIYGGAAAFEAGGYLSDRVVLLLRLRERFVVGGASGRCHCQYGIGVKYIFKLPERITTLSKVTPQQRIGLCLAQVLGQCLPRKQAMPVTDVRHLSPMPAFRPFDEFHGLVKQRIRHFPLSLGKSGGDHKRHKHSGRQPEDGGRHGAKAQ